MNVGIAYPSFFSSFRRFFPNLFIIKDLSCVKELDLILFSGGEDISPSLYGEPNSYSFFSEERDSVETQIFGTWSKIRGKKPKILGVCRGHQLVNTLLGGTLFQDLHFQINREHEGIHELNLLLETEATSLFSRVNSMHHQGVKNVGSGLYCTAKWKETPEILESDDILTVQFHPEFMDHKEFFDFVKEKVEGKKPFFSPKNKINLSEEKSISCYKCGENIEADIFVFVGTRRMFCKRCRQRYGGNYYMISKQEAKLIIDNKIRENRFTISGFDSHYPSESDYNNSNLTTTKSSFDETF